LTPTIICSDVRSNTGQAVDSNVKEHVVHDTGQGEERVPQEIYLGICLWEGIWRCGKIYRELRPLGKLIVAVTSSGCQGLKTDIFF